MAKVGDRLPSMALFEDSLQNEINIRELTSNKKTIIFGVHGAFTPDCSKIHLPGFVVSANYLKSILNVHEIICISVNDPFVMSVWGEEHGAGGRIRMLADPSGDFVQVLDLAMNLPALGGLRSKRFSMIVGDTKVLKLNVEPDGTELGCSLAQNIVKSGIN
ncbi:peroxiredoxin-5, mitochondrial-like [Glossina fuscipes]|uniref:Peroxiredoxin-5 n=1 Tax=Glossina fuscipes TaxID=7396 RepID=A0A8U0WIM2_9MUSC|nr:peroxiredoxin-5, mitochondrial-like [Glossina fuscipes]